MGNAGEITKKWSRREFWASSVATLSQQAKAAARPNLVIFYVDQLQATALKLYRPDGVETPNLARLSAQGVTFEHAFTPHPLCMPARASLVDRTVLPWYKGTGPRVGLAYSPDGKTTFRSAFGRSFGRVTVVHGSDHYMGFAVSPRFSSADQNITPAFMLDNGLPPYPVGPSTDPSFSNNLYADYWQGQQATRSPESLYWTFSIQRQVTTNTTIEAAYDATIGTHPNFTNPKVQLIWTVAQALRPYPQYATIATSTNGSGGGGGGEGDKSGHSAYHGLMIKAQQRFSNGLTAQWNYSLMKLLTDADSYVTGGLAQDQYNRSLEKSIGQYDQTHALKLNTLYELPLGKGKRFGNPIGETENLVMNRQQQVDIGLPGRL